MLINEEKMHFNRIYASIPGATSSSGGQFSFPCQSMPAVSMVFGGRKFDINPADSGLSILFLYHLEACNLFFLTRSHSSGENSVNREFSFLCLFHCSLPTSQSPQRRRSNIGSSILILKGKEQGREMRWWNNWFGQERGMARWTSVCQSLGYLQFESGLTCWKQFSEECLYRLGSLLFLSAFQLW
jgi:hypothetical protein